jgi:hypothetical protein
MSVQSEITNMVKALTNKNNLQERQHLPINLTPIYYNIYQ